jgi:hypothetical protein
MASNAGSSPTKRAWAVRQHAATETVANSAIQGFIQALGVFIDTGDCDGELRAIRSSQWPEDCR